MDAMTNGTSAPPPPVSKLVVVKRVAYFIIAITAILGNLLVATYFYQNRKVLLKKTYYVILLALSLTDIMTAIFLIATPAFLFDSGMQEPTNRIALLIYCKVLWGRLLLFIFGVASVYLILLLTVDRWIAVVKYTKYKTLMNRGRVIKGIALSYFLGVLFILPSHPNVKVYPDRPSGQKCSFVGTPHLKVTVTINFFGKAVFPFLAVAVMYAQIVYKIKVTSGVMNQQQSNKEHRKRITRIAFISSFAILFCWLPNQINLLLFAYQMSSVQSSFHDFTVGLVFLTSCINPFLYGLTSKKFRKGYVNTLQSFTSCTQTVSVTASSSQVGPACERSAPRDDDVKQDQGCSMTKFAMSPLASTVPTKPVSPAENPDNQGFDMI
ncbi:hypothetical protein QZH41_006740 [Actinostola sp. cb2023]|nr:hypothetical protein QZH41_006740 [Actinostola sp. cb2023]